jgi:redox-sensitive bicupin YhaK (pirin superfamily)
LIRSRPFPTSSLSYIDPFVMNTEAELRQAFTDFERGRFGSPLD